MKHPGKLFLNLAAALVMGAAATAHPSPEHKIEELESHLRESPSDPEMRIAYAAQLRKMDRFGDAEKQLLLVETLAPDHPGAALERARIAYYRNGDTAVAASLAEGLLKRHSRHAPAWDFLGQLRKKEGKTDEAIECYRRYIALSKELRAGDFTDLASMLSARGNPGDKEEAIEVLDQGVEKVGELAGIHLMASEIERSIGRHEAASRRFDKLAARYRPRPEWSRRKGEILLEAGRNQEAASSFDAALAMVRAMPPKRRADPEVRKLEAALEAQIETSRVSSPKTN